MSGKPELSFHKAVGKSSYCIKLSSVVVSVAQPNCKDSSEIKLEKYSCLDLGLDVVEQEVKTEELEVDTEEYSTYPISPKTEVNSNEMIVNKMLEQRTNTEMNNFLKSKDEGGEDKFLCDQCSFETRN